MRSEEKFEEFIKELPQMKALYGEKEMLLASNKSLAEYNLSQVSEGGIQEHHHHHHHAGARVEGVQGQLSGEVCYCWKTWGRGKSSTESTGK